MKQDAPSTFLLTTDDRDSFVSVIDHLLSLVYTNESAIASFLHTDVPVAYAHFFESVLQGISDVQSKERLLKEIRDETLSVPIIDLTLAFLPSRGSIEYISEQIRRIYQEELILHIMYNADLIAGAEIIYNGTYKDVSVRSRFNEVISQMKGAF